MALSHHYPDTTLLVTHYNRSQSLERLLKAFQDLGVSFGEIVVSDDGSRPEHQQKLQELQAVYPFRLITTPKNRGLGNNINKGQEAVTTPYTLYIQEDFVPLERFPASFEDAHAFMEADRRLDLVRFYSYVTYPYLKPYGKGFSEIMCSIWQPNYMKIYAYSDHPHLRRSNFLEKFGRYKEGLSVDKTEYSMCVAFFQKKGKGLVYDEYKTLLDQRNSSTEPSKADRTMSWKQRNNFLVRFIRTAYRTVKYNYDILFRRN